MFAEFRSFMATTKGRSCFRTRRKDIWLCEAWPRRLLEGPMTLQHQAALPGQKASAMPSGIYQHLGVQAQRSTFAARDAPVERQLRVHSCREDCVSRRARRHGQHICCMHLRGRRLDHSKMRQACPTILHQACEGRVPSCVQSRINLTTYSMPQHTPGKQLPGCPAGHPRIGRCLQSPL